MGRSHGAINYALIRPPRPRAKSKAKKQAPMATQSHPANVPVLLELAFLPRDQIGPFLLLGVDKTGGKDQIEANWAQRLIWARKNLTTTALEDINWAREVLNDPDKRVRADAASLNI